MSKNYNFLIINDTLKSVSPIYQHSQPVQIWTRQIIFCKDIKIILTSKYLNLF